MKKIKTIFLLVSSIFLLSACDFSETCHYKGNLAVKLDWKQLPSDATIPDSLLAYFYSENSSPFKTIIKKDTLLSDLAAGQQHFVAISNMSGFSIINGDNFSQAQIKLSTHEMKGKKYISNAPMLFIDQQELNVLPFETSKCIVTPAPGIQQVNFNFNVLREKGMGFPVSLSGELTGVATSYNLLEKEASTEVATLEFTGDKTTSEKFQKRIRFFGLKKNSFSKNILTVNMILTDGYIHSASFDLTDKIAVYSKGVVDCTFLITISQLGMELTITDWKRGEWGTHIDIN